MSLRSPARHIDKSKLFESLEDSQLSSDSSSMIGGASETFVPRRSVKKLTIKPKSSEVGVESFHVYISSFFLPIAASA